jgi:3-dehydroquinate synthase
VVKYAVLGDAELFAALGRGIARLTRSAPGLDELITRCVRIKAEIVSKDERESGPRQALNLGHTFGHALEQVTHYRRFLHGEAVGWGLICAAELAARRTLLKPDDAGRIVRLVLRVGKLPPLGGITAKQLWQAMQTDKKAKSGRLRFILPVGIGKVEPVDDVTQEQVAEVWKDVQGMRGA